MSKRIAICPVVHDAVNGWHASVADVAPTPNVRAIIPTDPATGGPLYKFCLVYVAANDFTAIAALPNVTLLPDATLDTAMSALSKGSTDTMNAAVPGVDLTGQGNKLAVPAYLPTDGYSTVVAGLLQQFDPTIPLSSFSVSDVIR